MMRRILAAAAAMLMAFVGLSLTTASAATLNLAAAPGAFLLADSACAPGTDNGNPVIDATASTPGTAGNFSEISLTNIPAACDGRTVDVYAHGEGGAVVATGSGTAEANSAAISVGDYTGSAVTAVVVRISGWLFPATWTPPVSSSPLIPDVNHCLGILNATGELLAGPDCTLTSTPQELQYLDEWNGGPGYHRDVRIVSTFSPHGQHDASGQWQNYAEVAKWRATLDLTSPEISTGIDLSGDYYIYNVNATALAAGEDCSDLTAVTFEKAGGYDSGVFAVSDAPVSWGSLLCSG